MMASDAPGAEDNAAHVFLIPVPTHGRSDVRRELTLDVAQKIGRAVQNKVKPAVDNAIFDSKVLSRTHAEIWHENGKVFIKDTKSSNGTYVNNVRLSASGVESEPCQLQTGDRLKLGVDVVENNTAAHKCVVLDVTVTVPSVVDTTPAQQKVKSLTHQTTLQQAHVLTELEEAVPVSKLLAEGGQEALIEEIGRLRDRCKFLHESVIGTRSELQQAEAHERVLTSQLSNLASALTELEASVQDQCDGAVNEGKLISRVATLEALLQFYVTRSGQAADTEVTDMRQQVVRLQEERHQYEMAAKETVRKIMEEKHAAILKLHEATNETGKIRSELRDASIQSEEAVGKLLEQQRQMQETIATLDEANHQLQKQLAEAQAELSTQASESTSQAVEEAQAEHAAAMDKLHVKVHELEQRLTKETERSAEARGQVDALDAQLQEAKDAAVDEKSELEEANERLQAALNAALADLQAAQQQREELTELKDRLAKANEIVSNADKQVSLAVDNLKDRDDRCQKLTTELESVRWQAKLFKLGMPVAVAATAALVSFSGQLLS